MRGRSWGVLLAVVLSLPAGATEPSPTAAAPLPAAQPARTEPARPVVPSQGRERPVVGAPGLPPPALQGAALGAPQPPELAEWLVFSLSLAQAQAQRQALQGLGLRILRRRQLPGLGGVVSVYQMPPGQSLAVLEQQLQAQFPDWQQERNQRYLPLQDVAEEASTALQDWAWRAVGRSRQASIRCGEGRVLAMLDGPVDPELEAFAGARLSYLSVVDGPFMPRSEDAARHGNGIAALLVGQQHGVGLLPAARLHALGVYGEDAEVGLHTRTDWLLVALDQLATLTEAPSVANLSFGGGHSRLLEQVFLSLQSRLQFVAAAGNDGRQGMRYPAAYPGVVAVGAVDLRLRRTRFSNYGAGLRLFAPGEDVWTLDETGQGYFASGTSLAAPFVSAALAQLGALPRVLELAQPLPAVAVGSTDARLVRLPDCR